jgi:hypothetical protein
VLPAPAREALRARRQLWVLGFGAAAAVSLLPISQPDAGVMIGVAGLAFWLRREVLGRFAAALGRDGHRRIAALALAAEVLQLVATGAVLAGYVL